MPKTKSTEPASPKRTKLATLIDLLKRAEGATLEDMTEATGWQPHSVRGAMSGSLKKAMGLTIASQTSGNTRVYRIVEDAA